MEGRIPIYGGDILETRWTDRHYVEQQETRQIPSEEPDERQPGDYEEEEEEEENLAPREATWRLFGVSDEEYAQAIEDEDIDGDSDVADNPSSSQDAAGDCHAGRTRTCRA